MLPIPQVQCSVSALSHLVFSSIGSIVSAQYFYTSIWIYFLVFGQEKLLMSSSAGDAAGSGHCSVCGLVFHVIIFTGFLRRHGHHGSVTSIDPALVQASFQLEPQMQTALLIILEYFILILFIFLNVDMFFENKCIK